MRFVETSLATATSALEAKLLPNSLLAYIRGCLGRGANLRRTMTVVYTIEETARHAGHADILREPNDGATSTGY